MLLENKKYDFQNLGVRQIIKWPEWTQPKIGYRLNQRIFPESSAKEERNDK